MSGHHSRKKVDQKSVPGPVSLTSLKPDPIMSNQSTSFVSNTKDLVNNIYSGTKIVKSTPANEKIIENLGLSTHSRHAGNDFATYQPSQRNLSTSGGLLPPKPQNINGESIIENKNGCNSISFLLEVLLMILNFEN